MNADGAASAVAGAVTGDTGAALRPYLASVAALGFRRLATTALLVLLGTAVESLGIMLAVPILAVLFRDQGKLPGWAASVIRLTGATAPAAQMAVLLAAMTGVAMVRGIVLWRRDMATVLQSSLLVDRWRARMIGALARAPWTTLATLRRSNVEHVIGVEVSRLSLGSDRLFAGGSAVVQIVLQFGLAIWLSPQLALGALVLFAAVMPLVRPLMRSAQRYGAALSVGGGKRHDALSDMMAGMKLAKAYDVEERYAADFLAASAALRARSIAYGNAQGLGRNAFQVGVTVVAGGLFLIGIEVARLSPAVLSALLLLLARLSGPSMNLVQGMQSVATMLPAVAHLLALEQRLTADAPAFTAAAPADPAPAPALTPARPAAIAFAGIGFRYPGADAAILHDVAATIGAGELVAIVGPSGAGKTTLADLVIGLAAPTAGALLVDGAPVNSDRARAAWRRQTAYVPQDPFLFDQSVLDNLRWAAPEADDASIWQALDEAEASGFVRALPDGLHTRVGDRGLRLSGGERQRLCLARALLRRPRLLLLDEATNALDRETERRLLATLRRLSGRLTMLMITHRPPGEALPDQVLELVGGRLRPVGGGGAVSATRSR